MIIFVTMIHISIVKEDKDNDNKCIEYNFLDVLSTTSGKDISINPKIKVYRHIFITCVKN